MFFHEEHLFVKMILELKIHPYFTTFDSKAFFSLSELQVLFCGTTGENGLCNTENDAED